MRARRMDGYIQIIKSLVSSIFSGKAVFVVDLVHALAAVGNCMPLKVIYVSPFVST